MNIEKLAFKNYYELINIQKIDLLLIIEFLQKDRKQWINQFTQTHNESVEIQKENKQLKDNWNKLKKYLINDINNRNGDKVIEYEDSRKVSETISPIYTLMEDKSKTMKEVLDKMQELEQRSDSNDS
nr:MAG TPA: hypothetical protein [Crassvirales sp.]